MKHPVSFRKTITLLPLYYYTCFHTHFTWCLMSSTGDSTMTDASEGIPLTQSLVVDPAQAIFKHLSKPGWQAWPWVDQDTHNQIIGLLQGAPKRQYILLFPILDHAIQNQAHKLELIINSPPGSMEWAEATLTPTEPQPRAKKPDNHYPQIRISY